jgi:hypothetical protein
MFKIEETLAPVCVPTAHPHILALLFCLENRSGAVNVAG